eukprot:2002092-Rhodomonas_salina.3
MFWARLTGGGWVARVQLLRDRKVLGGGGSGHGQHLPQVPAQHLLGTHRRQPLQPLPRVPLPADDECREQRPGCLQVREGLLRARWPGLPQLPARPVT